MTYLNLLPSTIITKGKNRACLTDVEKNHFCTVPKNLTDLFEESNIIDLEEVEKKLSQADILILVDYVNFLEENGFAVKSRKKINFDFFDFDFFESPFKFQNIILDLGSAADCYRVINKIENVPQSLQLRLYFVPNVDCLYNILNQLLQNDFNNIELVCNYNLKISFQSYQEIFDSYRILSRIVLMRYPKTINLYENKILGIKESLKTKKQCGKISKDFFYTGLYQINLSYNCNSCLYKKISVDINGDIKNCPSMPESYGNIKDTSLEEALNKPGFKKYWNITKDQIEVCKDCEFRHVCTDCRAYTERTKFEKDIDLSKPLKCGYNPYTNEWAEWSTNPLKEKAIEYYGMEGLVKKEGA